MLTRPVLASSTQFPFVKIVSTSKCHWQFLCTPTATTRPLLAYRRTAIYYRLKVATGEWRYVWMREALKQRMNAVHKPVDKHRNLNSHSEDWGSRWCSWLRHCATSWKVAGSIPDGVTGILQWLNPSGRIVALGSTQPLTEMSTKNPSWG
jgi:hypothetical protein